MPCQTSFAVIPAPMTAPLPTSVTVSVPAGEAAGLAAYSDDAGIMMMIGPANWACHGLYGADGSGGSADLANGRVGPFRPRCGMAPVNVVVG